MIQKFLLVCLLASVIACGGSQRPPRGILTREEMIEALCQVYIIEEKVNKLALRRDTAKAIFDYFEPKMFEKMGITDSVFQQSLEYYKSRPDELEQIYSAAVDTLALREHRAPNRFPTR